MNVTTRDLSVSDDREVSLTVTVADGSIREIYDRIVSKLRRTAQIKGFRRGRAPREVLIRKFGSALLAQTADEVINKTLLQVVAEIEHKPLPFAPPTVGADSELALGEDFTFTVTYDTTPLVVLGAYQNLPLSRPQVTITDADLEPELNRLQEQNAEVLDKPADPAGQVAVANGDVVTVNYVELDAAGQPVADSERRDFVFEVGSGYNVYEMDAELEGMARGAEKVITKSFPADYRHSDLAGRTVTLRVTVTSIKEKKLPDLDDELAQDISDRFQTLDDLKADLRRQLQSNADRLVRDRLILQFMDQVLAASQVSLPKSLIAAELDIEWREIVARFGGDAKRYEAALAARGVSKEGVLEQCRPLVERRARVGLLRDELAEMEGIEVNKEDLDVFLTPRAEARGISVEELRMQYERDHLIHHVHAELRNDKLLDRLIAGSAVTPGPETSYVDLVSGNQ